MPTAVKPGMAGRGIRAAVVHRGADGDAGRHLVVEQAADARAQQRLEPARRARRPSRACRNRCSRSGCPRGAEQPRRARRRPPRPRRATRCRRLPSAASRAASGTASPDTRSSVLAYRQPGAAAGAPPVTSLRARPTAASRRSTPSDFATAGESSGVGAAASKRALTPSRRTASVASPATSSTRLGFVQNWPVPIRLLRDELVRRARRPRSASAPGRITTGLTLGELEVDRLAGGVGGGLELQAGGAAAGVARRAGARVGDEPLAVFVAGAVEQLHGAGRQAGLGDRGDALPRPGAASCRGASCWPWRSPDCRPRSPPRSRRPRRC